jgi:phospholipase/carboxylesterase
VRALGALVACALACEASRPEPRAVDPSPREAAPRAGAPMHAPWGGLQVAERGEGERAVVLLHGYGARGDDLVDFANRLVVDVPQTLFVIPSAPLTSSSGHGRAWFEPPASAIDGSGARREAQREIDDARDRLEGVIDTLRGRGIAPGRVVLAGFSQGAMMSLDVALRGEARVRGVGFLSGGALPGWSLDRARGLAIFASHGTRDDILSFDAAERLRAQLEAAGAEVEWTSFDGGHGIPPVVREGFAWWLRRTLDD